MSRSIDGKRQEPARPSWCGGSTAEKGRCCSIQQFLLFGFARRCSLFSLNEAVGISHLPGLSNRSRALCILAISHLAAALVQYGCSPFVPFQKLTHLNTTITPLAARRSIREHRHPCADGWRVVCRSARRQTLRSPRLGHRRAMPAQGHQPAYVSSYLVSAMENN